MFLLDDHTAFFSSQIYTPTITQKKEPHKQFPAKFFSFNFDFFAFSCNFYNRNSALTWELQTQKGSKKKTTNDQPLFYVLNKSFVCLFVCLVIVVLVAVFGYFGFDCGFDIFRNHALRCGRSTQSVICLIKVAGLVFAYHVLSSMPRFMLTKHPHRVWL